MSAASYTSYTTPSTDSTETLTRASVLVHRVRGLSDDQVSRELRERREMSHEDRMQRATAARKERARLAAGRIRAL